MVRFRVGRSYTRREIHETVGGGLRECLPHRGGSVVCAAFTVERNPRAPRAVLIRKGAAMERWGGVFAGQRQSVPLFLKRGPGRWEYAGPYRVAKRSSDPATIAAHAPPADRGGVSMVLFLQRSGTGSSRRN